MADQMFCISQTGSTNCGYKITPTTRSHGPAAATNTVSVTASNGCTWSVENTNTWILILAGVSGTGTGVVSYAVDANPNPVARIGSVLIANEFLTPRNKRWSAVINFRRPTAATVTWLPPTASA